MSEPAGGPAFPHHEKNDDGTHFCTWGGMDLRDWLAGQALAGGIARSSAPEYDLKEMFGSRSGIRREEILAADAYRIADAFIARREVKP